MSSITTHPHTPLQSDPGICVLCHQLGSLHAAGADSAAESEARRDLSREEIAANPGLAMQDAAMRALFPGLFGGRK